MIWVVPVPHSEAAGQDAVCCPSVEGGEKGSGEVGSLRPPQDVEALDRPCWSGSRSGGVQERSSIMCTMRTLELLTLSTVIQLLCSGE